MTTEERIQRLIDGDADRHRAGAPEYRSGMVGAEGPVVHGTEISQESPRSIAPEDTTTPGMLEYEDGEWLAVTVCIDGVEVEREFWVKKLPA